MKRKSPGKISKKLNRPLSQIRQGESLGKKFYKKQIMNKIIEKFIKLEYNEQVNKTLGLEENSRIRKIWKKQEYDKFKFIPKDFGRERRKYY